MIVPGWDFRNPNYVAVFRRRIEILRKIRLDPTWVPKLKAYYKLNKAQFITDWGCTFDPRNVERNQPAVIPFILFPKQVEWINWTEANWRASRRGWTKKSRDVGMSWLCVAFASACCIFEEGFVAGFGSRKEEYVDKLGSPKALFPKARLFLQHLPIEFRGGVDLATNAPHMRITFPDTGSIMSGEAGDNIGRGDRTSIYFVDEAAYLERPELVEAALSQTTNCRQDVSSARGMANPFAQRVHSAPPDRVFMIHWRDDPRKDETWYKKQCEENDPIVVAQEIDIDFSASVEGVLLPNAWVQAAVDAHVKLGIEPTGDKVAALDVADEGRDQNAWAASHGILVTQMAQWSGKGSDIYDTTQKAFALDDHFGIKILRYDADGLGSGVRGDGRKLNELRASTGMHTITLEAFRGSGAVAKPDSEDVKGRKNQDFFMNAKSQAWWRLRMLFQYTYMAVAEGRNYDPEMIISLSSDIKLLSKLTTELIQPTYSISQTGKIVIDKVPDGALSPNLADALMMLCGGARNAMRIDMAAVARFGPVGRIAKAVAAPGVAVAQGSPNRVSTAALARFR